MADLFNVETYITQNVMSCLIPIYKISYISLTRQHNGQNYHDYNPSIVDFVHEIIAQMTNTCIFADCQRQQGGRYIMWFY